MSSLTKQDDINPLSTPAEETTTATDAEGASSNADEEQLVSCPSRSEKGENARIGTTTDINYLSQSMPQQPGSGSFALKEPTSEVVGEQQGAKSTIKSGAGVLSSSCSTSTNTGNKTSCTSSTNRLTARSGEVDLLRSAMASTAVASTTEQQTSSTSKTAPSSMGSGKNDLADVPPSTTSSKDSKKHPVVEGAVDPTLVVASSAARTNGDAATGGKNITAADANLATHMAKSVNEEANTCSVGLDARAKVNSGGIATTVAAGTAASTEDVSNKGNLLGEDDVSSTQQGAAGAVPASATKTGTAAGVSSGSSTNRKASSSTTSSKDTTAPTGNMVVDAGRTLNGSTASSNSAAAAASGKNGSVAAETVVLNGTSATSGSGSGITNSSKTTATKKEEVIKFAPEERSKAAASTTTAAAAATATGSSTAGSASSVPSSASAAQAAFGPTPSSPSSGPSSAASGAAPAANKNSVKPGATTASTATTVPPPISIVGMGSGKGPLPMGASSSSIGAKSSNSTAVPISTTVPASATGASAADAITIKEDLRRYAGGLKTLSEGRAPGPPGGTTTTSTTPAPTASPRPPNPNPFTVEVDEDEPPPPPEDTPIDEDEEQEDEQQRMDDWAAYLGAEGNGEVDAEWLKGLYDLQAGALEEDDDEGDVPHGNSQSVPYSVALLEHEQNSRLTAAGGLVVVPTIDEAGGGATRTSSTIVGTAAPTSGSVLVVGASAATSSSSSSAKEQEAKWVADAIAFIGKYMTSELKLDEVETKIVQPLQEIANEIGLKGEMKCFGSFMSGFANKKSDLDVTFIQQDSTTLSPHDILTRVANKLEKSGAYDSITKVLHAQSPLVRCTNMELQVEVEILMNNQLGVENSKLLHCYAQIDPRVAQLVRLVKTWAKHYEVLGSQDGCINSYAYVLLTLYYLVAINFLPNLQLLAQAMGIPSNFVSVKKWGTPDIVDTRFWSKKLPDFRPDNAADFTLYQLVKGFFEFYLKFPWATSAVCLRQHLPGAPATQTPKQNLFFFEHTGPAVWHIEDPFDVKHNLAGRTTESGRKRITDAMKQALENFTNFDEAFQTNRKARFWLKASISSTVTPKQVLDIFKDVELVRLYFPKYETFFQEDPNKRPHLYGAPRYKNIMLEFSSQADLRQAEMRNEVFLCESQLRLHKTTTGFVEEEVKGKEGAYYEFDLSVSSEELETAISTALAERDATIAKRSTESPKFVKGEKGGKGSGTTAKSDGSSGGAYFLGVGMTEDDAKSWNARSANNSKQAYSAGNHAGYTPYDNSVEELAKYSKTGLAGSPSAVVDPTKKDSKEASLEEWNAQWYMNGGGGDSASGASSSANTPHDGNAMPKTTELRANAATFTSKGGAFDYGAAAAYGMGGGPGGAAAAAASALAASAGMPPGYAAMQPGKGPAGGPGGYPPPGATATMVPGPGGQMMLAPGPGGAGAGVPPGAKGSYWDPSQMAMYMAANNKGKEKWLEMMKGSKGGAVSSKSSPVDAAHQLALSAGQPSANDENGSNSGNNTASDAQKQQYAQAANQMAAYAQSAAMTKGLYQAAKAGKAAFYAQAAGMPGGPGAPHPAFYAQNPAAAGNAATMAAMAAQKGVAAGKDPAAMAAAMQYQQQAAAMKGYPHPAYMYSPAGADPRMMMMAAMAKGTMPNPGAACGVPNGAAYAGYAAAAAMKGKQGGKPGGGPSGRGF